MFKKMRSRIIKDFMDMLILSESRRVPISGYDVVALIHKKYNVLVSSGTVYSTLYSLERNGLIRGNLVGRGRVYRLTDDGEKIVQAFSKVTKKVQLLLISILAVPNE